MEASKIILSEAEQQLIKDVQVILTKNSAIQKIEQLFGNLAEQYQELSKNLSDIHPAAFAIHPKISKGEKYKGFPWLMLDYPRSFDKSKGHLAIRTFFWWGHFFSIQLQVSGDHFLSCLQQSHEWSKTQSEWLIGLTTDPWDLDLPNDNWEETTADKKVLTDSNKYYLKLAKKFPIDDWEKIDSVCTEAFKKLILFLEVSLST